MENRFLRRYKKWLKTKNDLTDCAYFADDGKRSRRLRQAELEEFRRNPSFTFVERHVKGLDKPVRIYRTRYSPTYDQLAAHLVSGGTSSVYTSNSSKADTLLMLADIDDKQGTGKPQEAATYLSKRYFGGHTWIDFSTFGKGRHVYFVLDVKFVKRTEVYKVFKKFSDVLEKDPRFTELGCKFDGFYGLPTIWGTNKGGHASVVTRGDLLKLPFADTNDALTQLETLKSLDFDVLRRFVSPSPPTPALTSHNTQSPIAYDILTKPPQKRRRGWTIRAADVRGIVQPVNRMHAACTLYRNTYRKLPETHLDLLQFYEGENFNTGEDVKGRRVRRASQVLNFQRTHTDSQKKFVLGFEAERCLSLVKEHVREEHRAGVKCDRRVDDLDLAIGLYLIEMNATTVSRVSRWQFTTGNDAIVKMFVSLREAGVSTQSCNLNKAVAVKNILTNSGLTSVVDADWTFMGNGLGTCKKFGLGPAHPDYASFEKLLEEANGKRAAEPKEFMGSADEAEVTPVSYADFFDEVLAK